MIPRSVKAPTIPIPFGKLLEVVAMVDPRDLQAQELIEHIRGQQRYVEHKRFNESVLINASTSPFYPLFASLDVNAKSSVNTIWAPARRRNSGGSSIHSCLMS